MEAASHAYSCARIYSSERGTRVRSSAYDVSGLSLRKIIPNTRTQHLASCARMSTLLYPRKNRKKHYDQMPTSTQNARFALRMDETLWPTSHKNNYMPASIPRESCFSCVIRASLLHTHKQPSVPHCTIHHLVFTQSAAPQKIEVAAAQGIPLREEDQNRLRALGLHAEHKVRVVCRCLPVVHGNPY